MNVYVDGGNGGDAYGGLSCDHVCWSVTHDGGVDNVFASLHCCYCFCDDDVETSLMNYMTALFSSCVLLTLIVFLSR